jgi:hypothetical protein
LWREIGGEVVRLAGIEDDEIRKKAKEILFHILNLSKNALMLLETLYYQGDYVLMQGYKASLH